MAAPTTIISGTSTDLATTGEGNGLLKKITPTVTNARIRIGFSGASVASAVMAVRGRLRGVQGIDDAGGVFYPLVGKNLTTGMNVPDSGAISLADAANSSFEFACHMCDQVEIYAVSGTLTSLVVEERVEPASPNESPIVVNTSTSASTFSAGLTLNGATGANVVTITDNLADAFNIKEGSTSYLKIVTTDSSERIVVAKQTKFADSVKLSFGDADDITMAWDGTDFDVLQATANSSIKWGIDGAGIDHVFYGDTASAKITWDQSADSLLVEGVAKIKLQTIVAAHAAAIPVTHSGSLPITQAGAETNTLADPTYLGQTISIFVDTDTSGARVITAASRINQAGNTIITLTEVGDFIKLEAITIAGALKWQVVSNDGAALSGP